MTIKVPPLRFISTPSSFMILLRMNMQKSDKIHHHIKGFVEKHQDLHGLILRGMKDIDENQRLDKILVSLGWYGLRDRLAAHYLHYSKHKNYAIKADVNLVDDILIFEKKLIGHTVEGYSRSFMLGFYLKLLNDHLSDYLDKSEIFSISTETIELCELAKIKTLPIDWILLAIEHFKSFIGKDEVHRFLLDGGQYFDLFSKLNDEEKNIYIKNMIIYGASIGEQTPFVNNHLE
jgi:hypothetical protein